MIPQNYPLYAENYEGDWFTVIGWVEDPEKWLNVTRYAPLVVSYSWGAGRAFAYMGPVDRFTTTPPDLPGVDDE